MGLIGKRLSRVEDHALLTGTACFTGDVRATHHVDGPPTQPAPAERPPAPLTVHFVRSTMAHARFTIEVGSARRAPGVVEVLVAGDLGDTTGPGALPVADALRRPTIASDRVRFVGEIVAVVVADCLALAVDAAELVHVAYEPLVPLPSLTAALSPGAAAAFPTVSPTNVVLDQHPAGDTPRVGDVVVDLHMINQRIATAPLEGAAILATPTGGGLIVTVSTQAPHAVRDAIAEACGLEPRAVRVIGGWVGGAFGGKSVADVEHVLVAKVAMRIGQATRWVQDRSENLQGMHGRGQDQYVRIGVDRDGTLRSIHAELDVDNGAYPGFNHFLAGLTASMMAGPYRFDSAVTRVRSVTTNTSPLLGYRGAGRPEATSLIERVVDVAAAELGIDPAEFRLRNLISADQFPYTTPTGATYDSGAYHEALRQALRLADYDQRRQEQHARRARGSHRVLGIGVCTYVEVTAGFPPVEYADVEIDAQGRVHVKVGTFAHGQGHQTSYAQIAGEVFGVDHDRVTVIDGDTAQVARGGGTFGSRSMQVGGSAVHAACAMVIDRGREAAAVLLEASADDIVFAEGRFAVAGVPTRSRTLRQVASHLAETRSDPSGPSPGRTGLFASVDWERAAPTYPFGAHVAVVEVDTDTGNVVLVHHTAVDDCGLRLNPVIVEGQVHGGIAQGVGQALYEQVVYDQDGAVLTASFADYPIVSAAELPFFTLGESVTPTPVNPLGIKGVGESGIIGATPAVHNAVVDALAHLGIRHIDMPCTPERIWRAIHAPQREGGTTVPGRRSATAH